MKMMVMMVMMVMVMILNQMILFPVKAGATRNWGGGRRESLYRRCEGEDHHDTGL